MLRPTTIPYSEQCQPWSGPSYYCTPPYPVRLSELYPTSCATPYNYSLQRTVSAMEWALLLMDSILPCTIEWTPPYPCATPYTYSLQRTVSAMEWTHLLMDSTLPCTIEWTPPYPLQLFLTVNSVNHGVGPLINGFHPTLLSGLHHSPVLHPTPIPYSEQCQPWSGPSY